MSLRLSTKFLLSLISLDATHVLIWSRRRWRTRRRRREGVRAEEERARCRGEHMQRLVFNRSSWKPSCSRRCLWLSVTISEIHTHLHHSYRFTEKDAGRWKRATLTCPVRVPVELPTFWSEPEQIHGTTLAVLLSFTCSFLISFLRSASYFSFWFVFAALWSCRGERRGSDGVWGSLKSNF